VIWRNVGTMQEPRGLPKAWISFAAMGSDEASAILKGMGEDKYAHFDTPVGQSQDRGGRSRD